MRAGVKLQMIPYTGGPAQALGDLATGRVQIVLDAYSGLAGGMQAGAIKGLAVASLERLPGIDLPTVAQTLPGFFAGGWNVMLAPNGTAPLHMRKLGFDIRKVLDEPAGQGKARRARRLRQSDERGRAGRLHQQPAEDLEAGRRGGGEGSGEVAR